MSLFEIDKVEYVFGRIYLQHNPFTYIKAPTFLGHSLRDSISYDAKCLRQNNQPWKEPLLDKITKVEWAHSEDSDQPGQSSSLIRVFDACLRGSLGLELATCGQRRF